MANLAKKYLEVSELDFLGPFANLWMGFNSWYRDKHPNEGDQNGCLLMAGTIRPVLEPELLRLNDVDSFITQEVDSLATCQCNGYTYSHDVSGFKFRLQCQNQSAVTEFLQRASYHPLLQPHTDGLRFFESIGRPDLLFQYLYREYRGWEASSEGIVHSADAARISTNLAQIGVQHYGHMLFHNFATVAGTGLYNLDSVFGPGRIGLLSSISVDRRRDVAIAFGENSPETYAFDLRRKSPDVTSLYLYIVYKFRCEYFHGNIDPRVRANQELAKSAFFSLRELMEATVVDAVAHPINPPDAAR
jgi:hypothetical protein